jgi:hypothetical protein
MEIWPVLRFRFARWYIFKPKNPNLGKFWRALQWIMFVYFMAICLFYGHLVFLLPFGIFTAIWYISWPFGIFFTVLECCIKKSLATLLRLKVESRGATHGFTCQEIN